MNILFATSEATPFAKTGGLGDVCGALPIELVRLGHDAAVILPAYRCIQAAGEPICEAGIELEVQVGRKQVAGSLLESRLPGSDVPVYFVRQDEYFDRPQLYGERGKDYRDNCERFVFFCRAVFVAAEKLGRSIDILHCHDWTTGLIPAYLRIERPAHFGDTASLFTIHNLAYQGRFWHWDMSLTGLDWKHFNWREMEFFGQLNLMKTGLVFADAINTVSPTYAEEIQTTELGCDLDPLLVHRRESIRGIINGIDYQRWNPETDPHLAANYNGERFASGKAACQEALLQEMHLPHRPEKALIGFVGRLFTQKGIELILNAIEATAGTQQVQWVVLGTGDPKYETELSQLAGRFPEVVAARLEFSESLAHQIEAAADLFVMPSEYEPCGLNQLYSLRYGTVPVVRATGGLADTVTDTTEATLADGTATGFSFGPFTTEAFLQALGRALDARQDQDVWRQIVTNGMRQDWSWPKSAGEYVELYEATRAKRGMTKV